MADAKIVLERLNNFNWPSWKFRMELLLVKEELFDCVSQPKPEVPTPQWKVQDGKARAIIGLALENDQLCHVMSAVSANEMWVALKSYHQRDSLTNKIHVLRKLFSLRLTPGGDMPEHLMQVTELVHRLNSIGEKLADHLIVAIILSSLPESYSALLSALESRPAEDLTLEFVKGRLLDEWRRRHENKVKDKALKVAGHSDSGDTKTKKKFLCHYCKQEGHFRSNCPKLAEDKQKKNSESAKNKSQQKANVSVAQRKEEENLELCFSVVAMEADCLAIGDDEPGDNMWLLDSGCTKHMTGNAENLDVLSESNEIVCLANGAKISAKGVGTGKLRVIGGNGESKTISIKNVLYVPELAGNLLSVGRIADEGFEVNFESGGCQILRNGKAVAVGERKAGLYYLKQPSQQCLLSVPGHSTSCQHLWHRRLGHRHPDAVKRIVSEGMGTGIKMSDCGVRSVCGVCCEGKLSRGPFPASKSKSTAVLDLVHSDLCGPMDPATPSGNEYVMTMIDDYSKFTVVYLLKHKSEAYDKIRSYVSLVENLFMKKPKFLRADGGGEYSSTKLKEYLSENGITLQQTAPYSPQQNGKAERANRSLMEMTRCLLLEARMKKKYWGEAVMTACYLYNRLPSATLDCTPFELWYGKKPKYNHMRVFGSYAWVHVPDEKRKKLDEKAIKMQFVGYAEDRKAYRFLNPETDRILISRDAKFLELEMDSQESVRELIKSKSTGVELSLDGTPDEEGSEACDTEVGKEDLNEDESDEEDLDATLQPSLEETIYDSASENEFLGNNSSDLLFEGFSPELRRSNRANKGIPPERYNAQANAICLAKEEPTNVRQARKSAEAADWEKAMQEEMSSHEANGTWELTKLPAGRKAIGSRWVYKVKYGASGEVVKYKARLVAQGFAQEYGVDYEEVFAPVTSQTSFRVLLAIASRDNIPLVHLDVKTAYLHGELEEELYMRQPPGFEVPGKKNLVCRLKRSIYGLKQSARCWYRRLHDILVRMGFRPCAADPCMYVKAIGDKLVYLLVYVDDIVLGCVDESITQAIFKELRKHLDITNLGELKYFLGMEIQREDGKYSLSLRGYIEKLAMRFGMADAKHAKIPMDEGFLKLECEQKLADPSV